MSWPGGEHRLGRRRRRQCGGQAAKVVDVDLRVLVLAEVVLQRLQALHERLARRRGVQSAEAFEQVAQLLGVLAQLVQHLGVGVGRDRAATSDHRLVRPPDPPFDQGADRLGRVVRDVARDRRVEPVRPGPDDAGRPFAVEQGRQHRVLGASLPVEEVPHRVQRGGGGLAERARVVGPLDLVHVEVARRAGDLAEPAELLASPIPDVVGDHAARRWRAPTGFVGRRPGGRAGTRSRCRRSCRPS